ncbi:MAG: hypothetical protein J6C62_09155 [Clostridia bacterium]|nr:hypothetical protein [Clostridia bacterium]
MSLEILVAIATIASAITALGTFFIYRKNSKPKITLTILNKEPLFLNNEIICRNFYYVDDKQQNAVIQVEIENKSSVAGTLTDIFIHPKNSIRPSQAMTRYKDYNQDPLNIVFEDKDQRERYNKDYQALKQPITVEPYGYVIGFLFFPVFQFSTLEENLICKLEYRVAGINKSYSEDICLCRTTIKLSKIQELPPPRE